MIRTEVKCLFLKFSLSKHLAPMKKYNTIRGEYFRLVSIDSVLEIIRWDYEPMDAYGLII